VGHMVSSKTSEYSSTFTFHSPEGTTSVFLKAGMTLSLTLTAPCDSCAPVSGADVVEPCGFTTPPSKVTMITPPTLDRITKSAEMLTKLAISSEEETLTDKQEHGARNFDVSDDEETVPLAVEAVAKMVDEDHLVDTSTAFDVDAVREYIVRNVFTKSELVSNGHKWICSPCEEYDFMAVRQSTVKEWMVMIKVVDKAVILYLTTAHAYPRHMRKSNVVRLYNIPGLCDLLKRLLETCHNNPMFTVDPRVEGMPIGRVM